MDRDLELSTALGTYTSQDSREQLGTGGWIFLVFHQNHENIAEAPQHNILEGYPTQQRHEAQDAPHILRVLDVAEGELCHPRDLLPEPDTVVGTRLAQQLVHPEGKPHVLEDSKSLPFSYM